MYHLPPLFVLSAVCGLLVHLLRKFGNRNRLPLPPAIKSDPVIGHLRFLPSSEEHRVYRDWGNELNSDIISVTIMGQVLVILNSVEAATEIMVKRSAIYSDRPALPMLTDDRLVGIGQMTTFLSYGERWRSQRRMTHDVLHKKASESFWPVMMKQSRLAVQRLLDEPENFATEMKRMAGSTILSAVYGYEVSSLEDSMAKTVETATERIGDGALAGNFFVNTIPWLASVPSWFPGAGWKRTAAVWRQENQDMVNTPYEWTKAQMAAGTSTPCMVNQLLSGLPAEAPEYLLKEEQVRWATGTLFAAGYDTSVSSAMVFILAMVLHPDIQARAQAEIDAVVGSGRLPDMGDRDSLPLVRRIIKESLRWRTAVPVGVPHACIQDDIYKGYLIPKGAIIISNIWAMNNNPDVYTNPDRFDPDRFLDPSVPDAPAFGFGRRSCPGIHFAEAALFITISTLLTVFNITPARDELGQEIIPVPEMGPNQLVNHPVPFKCSITPRSEKHEQLLRHSVEM